MRKILKYLSVLIVICVSFSASLSLNAKTFQMKRESMDISSLVTQGEIKIYSSQGNDWEIIDPSEGPAVIEIGNSIKFEVTWELQDILINNLQAGDWFEIDLPGEYFRFLSSPSVEIKAMDSEGREEVVGTLTLEGNDHSATPKLIFILNETGATKQYLTNGVFFAIGQATKIKDESTNITVGAEDVPGIIINPVDPNKEQSDEGDLSKQGWQVSNQNAISWDLYVNYQEYKNVYNGGSLSGVKANTIFIDELPEGVVFKKLSIVSPIHAATSTGTMSANIVAGGWTNIDATANMVLQNSGETWEQFKTRVSGFSVFSIGVFQDSLDSRSKIIVNFGDLPGTINNPRSLAEIYTYIDNDGGLSESVKDDTKRAYDHIFNETGGVGTLGFVMQLEADVIAGNGVYENQATLSWDNQTTNSGAVDVNFQLIGGGASIGEPGSVIIVKKDYHDNTVLEGATFKLQKRQGDGTFSDYTHLDGGNVERTTNSLGQVVFSKLTNGIYKVVEVTPPSGYQGDPIFENNIDTFEINGSETSAIFMNVFNKLNLETGVLLSANKTLVGKKLEAGAFGFELKDDMGNILQTKANDVNGKINFDEIKYNQEGSYSYTINEVIGVEKGMTYDTHVIKVVVEVKEQAGQLVATATYDGDVNFQNTYKLTNDPQTGDSQYTQVLSGVLVVSLLIMIGCLYYTRKKVFR